MESNYFEVLATDGDTRLGGEDFDEKCVEMMVQRFAQQTGRDATRDRVALSRLKKSCERAKIELSDVTETTLVLPDLFDGADFSANLTRDEFNSINMPLFKRTIEKVAQVLNDTQLSPSDIADVVLVGGSTRIPIVRDLVSEFFEGKTLCLDVNPDEAVGYGAAVQGSIISSEATSVVVIDVYPLTLSVETVGGLMSPIISRNTRIPCEKKRYYTTHSDDAAGARIEIFEGERKFTRDNRVLGLFALHRLPRAVADLRHFCDRCERDSDGYGRGSDNENNGRDSN
jgi:molecular chaperone DnaK (HSP70)